MDFDSFDPTATTAATSETRKPIVAPVDDAHPFDLDSYISQYTGQTAVDRLIHITSTCPSIAPQSLALGLKLIKTYDLRDVSLYTQLIQAYEAIPSYWDGDLIPIGEVLEEVDRSGEGVGREWVDEMGKSNASEKSKLEVELKTYANNMIKESQRVRPFSYKYSQSLITKYQFTITDGSSIPRSPPRRHRQPNPSPKTPNKIPRILHYLLTRLIDVHVRTGTDDTAEELQSYRDLCVQGGCGT